MVAVLVGLWFGTDIGARFANRVDEHRLKKILIEFVLSMAAFMAFKALN